MKTSSSVLAVAISLSGLAPVAARAQAAPVSTHETSTEAPTPGPDATSSGIADIVVTAQRRSESLMAVPLSIQAFTGRELESKQINTITDLQFTTPGFFTSQSAGFTQVYLRGVGNSIFSGADPSVATYVDDVPRIWGSMSQNLFDVQRVEVLKGAQGGLYGRNATGGVINVITRQPDTSGPSADALLDYGERNTFRAAGYVNVPLGDKVAIALSAERATHDPYIRNIAVKNPYTAAMFPTGSFLGTPAQTAAVLNSSVVTPDIAYGRMTSLDGKILFKPTENLRITIAGDYTYKNDTDGNQNIQENPGLAQAFLTGLFGSFGFNPQLPPHFILPVTQKFTVAAGAPATNTLKDYGVSGTVVLSLPNVDITSISAYRHQNTLNQGDALTSNVPVVLPSASNNRTFYYQELRAASTWSGPLHLIGGATYLYNRLNGDLEINLLGGLAQSAHNVVRDVVRNWTIYLQGTYDITDHLSVTASGRYIHETNHAQFILPAVSDTSSTEQKFLPSVTISYKLDQGNVYARWAQGFKAGGVNPTAAPSIFPTPEDGSVFKPETVDTFEVGYRQALFERRLQLTTAVFYNDYKNLQYADHANAAYAASVLLALTNGKKARTWGVEQTVVYKLAEPLTLGASVSYLNAKYLDFELTGNPVLADFNFSGKRMIFSPKWQVSLNADLDQPLTDRVRLVGSLVANHVSNVLFQPSALPGVIPDSTNAPYWLVNLRVGFDFDRKYEIALFARNLTNSRYYVFGNSNAFGNTATWGNPRVIGGEVTAHF